jgi:NADPH:quinone reductase-like Zn-dependent oxidoreductase
MKSPDRIMRAMRASGADASSLRYEPLPVPSPGADEVLVQVRATAVTAGELTWPESWPAIPCHDLSGVVAGAGPEVTAWRDGDEVFSLVGFDRPGAAAEYTTVPAADLAAKPATADHVAAAALPLGALTAWQALHEHAGLEPGQHVLVHGGAGGVGAYAVQLAVIHGARVTATASARDAKYVADLGAEQVIDYAGRFEEQVREVDIVIDTVGGDTMARSWPVLRAGGILVAIAEEPDGDGGDGGRRDVRSRYFVVEPSGPQLRELARLVDDKRLHPAVSAVFGLSSLPEAFAAQQARRSPGKVIIEVGGASGR